MRKYLSLRFNGHFPGELGLAGVYWSKGWWRWWWQLDYWAISRAKLQSNHHHQQINMQMFPSVLWHCWLGDRKGIFPVKSWVLDCRRWWFDWRFARLIAPVVITTSIILCFSKHQLTQVHLENGRLNGEREFVGLCQHSHCRPQSSFYYFEPYVCDLSVPETATADGTLEVGWH